MTSSPTPIGLAHPRDGAQARFADPAAWRALQAADDAARFSTAWLSLMASTLDIALAPLAGTATVVTGGFVALRGPDGMRFVRSASQGGGEASFLLAKAAERCLQVRRAVANAGGRPAAADAPPAPGQPPPSQPVPCQIAIPLLIDDALEGVIAIEFVPEAVAALDTATRLAQWGAAWFRTLLKPRETDAGRDRAELAMAAMRIAALPGSAAAMGQALCTALAGRLGALRVSLGSGEGARMRVLATSRGALAETKTDFLVALGAALDEAVVSGRVLWPVPEGQTAAIGAHERLCRSHDADWAASLPHKAGRRHVVLCIEGAGPPPPTLEALAALLDAVAPLVALRLDAERSLAAHAGAAAAHAGRDWTVDGSRARWAGLAAAVAAILFLAFARGEYRVAAHATLEGVVKRALTAPFDGYLAEAHARPGDRVAAGAELGRLDTRELQLQRLDHKGRIAESQHQMDEAVGRRDFAAAAVAAARRAQSEAELALVEENLRRASLIVPFDAVVISGDPAQTIGAPLRHGDVVYEVSPLDGFRVAIDVDETDFAEITPGETGRLVLSSLPYAVWPVTVTGVTPLATAREGHTVFRVEARLDAQDAALRPGMQGVAKLAIGSRRYAWIWTHGVIAWARLKLWEWLP